MLLRGAALLLLAGLAVWPAACWAQTQPRLEVRAADQDATVYVNGRPALRFLDSGMGPRPEQRARIVLQRLERLLAKGISPKLIVAKTTPEGAAVVAPNLRIVDVTPADAALRGISVLTLARTWAANLQSFLTQPALGFSASKLVIPFGQTRSVQVTGVAEGTVEIFCSPEGLIDLRVDSAARSVIATGVGTGAGTITAKLGELQVDLPFEVRKLAGAISPAKVRITGEGPPAAVLKRLLQRAAYTSVYAEPGAKPKFGTLQLAKSGKVTSGTRASLPVAIEGPEYLPVKGVVEVSVEKQPPVTGEPDQLFYSNNPEMLRKYGSLFVGRLDPGVATRLLYHHQNIMGKNVEFVLDLFNTSSQPAQLHVIEGIADPQIDTFQIGHRAAARYLPNYFRGNGYYLDLQPGERYTLVRQRLTQHQTASGICDLRLVSGESLHVWCRADDPNWTTRPTLPPNPRLSEDVFPKPTKVIHASYEIGGQWAFVGIGKEAIKDAHGNRRLDGNYGVLYEVRFKLHNPKPAAQPVSLVFDPAAGVARGVFVVDGETIESNHLVPPNEFPLKTYMLSPGETRNVVVRTMPLAGSNYPARLVARVGTTIARR